jgi:hypothetical protein
MDGWKKKWGYSTIWQDINTPMENLPVCMLTKSNATGDINTPNEN